jgi:hypothetical protein
MKVSIEDGSVREEYDEDDHFVGQRRDRHAPSFQVSHDLYEGYFVAVRLADGDSHLVWIAQAKSDPNCNPEWPNCVLIQYRQGHNLLRRHTVVGILKLDCVGRSKN